MFKILLSDIRPFRATTAGANSSGAHTAFGAFALGNNVTGGPRPVTFQYKTDKTNRAHFGLIAEQVAEVNPDLVIRDSEGEIYTVRYDAVAVMLLNEFLKEQKRWRN